jgi:hypothetical protein
MNKRIVLLLSGLIYASSALSITASPGEGFSSKCYNFFFKEPEAFKFPFIKNKALNVLVWGSLGTFATALSCYTMQDAYNNVPCKGNSRHMGDKILAAMFCWVAAANNALEIYKSYK